MMRRGHSGKLDRNQTAIVAALRSIGTHVLSLAPLGKGAPDLLCWRHVVGYVLLEVKDGGKPPSARKLTADQVAFHAAWGGPIHVVESVDDALRAVTGQAKA